MEEVIQQLNSLSNNQVPESKALQLQVVNQVLENVKMNLYPENVITQLFVALTSILTELLPQADQQPFNQETLEAFTRLDRKYSKIKEGLKEESDEIKREVKIDSLDYLFDDYMNRKDHAQKSNYPRHKIYREFILSYGYEKLCDAIGKVELSDWVFKAWFDANKDKVSNGQFQMFLEYLQRDNCVSFINRHETIKGNRNNEKNLREQVEMLLQQAKGIPLKEQRKAQKERLKLEELQKKVLVDESNNDRERKNNTQTRSLSTIKKDKKELMQERTLKPKLENCRNRGQGQVQLLKRQIINAFVQPNSNDNSGQDSRSQKPIQNVAPVFYQSPYMYEENNNRFNLGESRLDSPFGCNYGSNHQLAFGIHPYDNYYNE